MADHAAAIRGIPRWHPNPIVHDTLATIRRFGWSITAVGDECGCSRADCVQPECPFAYTTGLGLHAIPELAVYGLDARTGCEVLNELGGLFHRLEWRQVVDAHITLHLDALDMPVRIIELLDTADLLVTHALFPDSPALQVIWPDDLGTYPWQAGYALEPRHQPVKGMPDTRSTRITGPRIISTYTGPNRTQRRQAQRRRPRE